MIDIEQLVIAEPEQFNYPIWPPKWMVDLVHWYGRTFDGVDGKTGLVAGDDLDDSLFFGPFYAVAIYAFIKGKTGSG
jgi:hypothetical protein